MYGLAFRVQASSFRVDMDYGAWVRVWFRVQGAVKEDLNCVDGLVPPVHKAVI